MDIYVKWPQLEEALNARRSRAPSAKSRASTPKARTPTPPPPRTPSPPHPSAEALEALRQIGELMDRHEVLIEQVDALEVCKYLLLYLVVVLVVCRLTFVYLLTVGHSLLRDARFIFRGVVLQFFPNLYSL